jgi:hypothetical protein
VTYTNNVIQIRDNDGNENCRYGRIVSLRTFDKYGMTNLYSGNGEGMLRGPGPLIIVRKQAFFQLFVIDPRGLIPTEAEEEELNKMNRPIFDAIPKSADVSLNVSLVEFSGDGMERRSASRRSFDGSDDQRIAPGQGNVNVFTECSDDIVFVALRNREARNPILRQQALSLIQLFLDSKCEHTFKHTVFTFPKKCFPFYS